MNYNLVLNDNEVNLVWASLENRPYKEVVGLLETIKHQVNAQIEERNKSVYNGVGPITENETVETNNGDKE